MSGEKGFALAYWREASTTGTDPETFFGKFTHFQRFLDHYGIEEQSEGVPEVEANWSRIRDYASPLEAIYGPGFRPRIVVEHDAKMRLMIEQLRAQHKPPAGYKDVRYWSALRIRMNRPRGWYPRAPSTYVVRRGGPATCAGGGHHAATAHAIFASASGSGPVSL